MIAVVVTKLEAERNLELGPSGVDIEQRCGELTMSSISQIACKLAISLMYVRSPFTKPALYFALNNLAML